MGITYLILLFLTAFVFPHASADEVIACQGQSVFIDCGGGFLKITDAFYGYWDHPKGYFCSGSCGGVTNIASQSPVCHAIVLGGTTASGIHYNPMCNVGVKSCTVTGTTNFGDPIPGAYKFLNVIYECVAYVNSTTNYCNFRLGSGHS